jgi:hypothetical protein
MAMYQDLQEALAGSPVTGGDHPADYLGNVSWTARQRGYDYAMQEYGLNTPGNEDLRDMVKKYLANEHQLNQLDMDHNSMDAVPDKPFKESWPDLVTKQHIMDVVNDPEKSWYGWTTGDQQVKRYGTQQLTWEKHPTEEGWNVRFQPQVGGRGQGIPDIGEEAIRRGLINNVSGHIKTREGLGALLYDQGGHKVSADKAWKRIQASPEFGVYQPRAEGMKSYYDVQEAGRVNRILKPFSEAKGVEKAPIEAPPTNKNQIYAGGNFGQIVEVPHDQEFNPLGVTANDPRQVASVWPKLAGTEGNNTLRNERRLVDLLKRQQDHPIFGQKNTNSFESWITRISPELKAQIKEKGLPLLTSLYMIWQHQQGQNAQTPPSTQPEQ